MSEFYEGRQFVGMDLHRRRSVLVRMTESGQHLEVKLSEAGAVTNHISLMRHI